MKTMKMKLVIIGCLAGLACAVWADKPPDSVQGVAVGARATGMGGAFTAIANDATASFWNPAGLAELKTFEATLVLSTVPTSETLVKVANNFSNPVSSTTSSPTGFDPMFASVALPIKSLFPRSKAEGILSLSFTRGGYFDETVRAVNLPEAVDPNDPPPLYPNVENYVEHRQIITDYYTLAYGAETKGIRWGIGGIYATQKYEYARKGDITIGGSGQVLVGALDTDPISDSNSGFGAIVGLQGLIKGKTRMGWGISYRSLIDVKADNGFSNEIPDRLSVGVFFALPKNWGLVSIDTHTYGSANSDLEDDRANITDWCIGYEKNFATKKGYVIPLRLGVATNKAANRFFVDQTIYTFGTGLRVRNYEFELATWMGTKAKTASFMFSATYRP
ncbi:MAG: hypothetical protein WCO51_08065 [bacterium]